MHVVLKIAVSVALNQIQGKRLVVRVIGSSKNRGIPMYKRSSSFYL